MALTVHPVGSDSGFSESSQLNSELHRLLHGFGGRIANVVLSPFVDGDFDLTTSTSSFDVDVAPGKAVTGGHLVQSDATVTRTLSSSTTSEIFLVVDDAKTNNAAIVAQDKSTSDPTGAYVVKLWEATTDGSGVTGQQDFRPWVPFRENTAETTLTGLQKGQVTGQPVDSVGVYTTSVSFPRAYVNAVDNVDVFVEAISDTSVSFGFVHAHNDTVTGFTLRYKVTESGPTGATADFGWKANGA